MNATQQQEQPDRALERWVEQFVVSLRMREVPGDRIGDLVNEVEAHCAESGESAQEAFGSPRDYAATRSTEVPARPGRAANWVRTLSPTFLGLAGFFLVGPSVAAAREHTGVAVSWGLVASLVLIGVAAYLAVRFGESVMAGRARFAVVLGIATVVLVLAPIVLHTAAFSLAVPVAAALSCVLLAMSVVGAYTWGRIAADAVTNPVDGSDRYSGTTQARAADRAVALQPWLFVVLAVAVAATTWFLG